MNAFQQARFVISAAKPEDLPPEGRPELAFAGRSNVGKSSAINTLTGRKRLAFASKTPGRTRLINFFSLGDLGVLADLPGYGYASAPKEMRAGWDALIGGYLQNRRCLAGVVVLMDARHPMLPNDRNFLEWLRPVTAPRVVVLTKADKLSRADQAKALASTRAALDRAALTSEVFLFSSLNRQGTEELVGHLEGLLKAGGAIPK